MDKSLFLSIVSVTFIICIFLAWYFTHKAKHKERLMMIDKGLNPHEPVFNQGGIKSAMFKLGIVIIGLSIGLAIIAILVECHAMGHSDATPIAIIGLCGGVALVVANRLSPKY